MVNPVIPPNRVINPSQVGICDDNIRPVEKNSGNRNGRINMISGLKSGRIKGDISEGFQAILGVVSRLHEIVAEGVPPNGGNMQTCKGENSNDKQQ